MKDGLVYRRLWHLFPASQFAPVAVLSIIRRTHMMDIIRQQRHPHVPRPTCAIAPLDAQDHFVILVSAYRYVPNVLGPRYSMSPC